MDSLIRLFKLLILFIQKVIHSNDISNTYYANVAGAKVFKEENSNLLIQFTQEMSNAIAGLGNLKTTYKDDITTVSNIEILIEKMTVRVKKIGSLLKINSNN